MKATTQTKNSSKTKDTSKVNQITLVDQKIIDHFLEWKNDDSRVKEASKHKVLSNKVILEFYYYYEPLQSENIIIPKGKEQILDHLGRPVNVEYEKEAQSSASRLFPIAKVLQVGSLTPNFEEVKPGDLVTISDNFTTNRTNPDWNSWRELKQRDPEAARDIPEPPRMVGAITQMKNSIYILNKFKSKGDHRDAYTFLVPESTMLSKYEN